MFAISEEPLKRALTAAGIRLTEDPEEIDVVVASFDRTFEYRKLQIAFDALWFHKRARLITSNPDRFCPMPGGRGEPDAASIVAAIEACTGATCEANLGKPGAEMLETVLGMLGLSADRCVMVGDRLSTDIAMAADGRHGLGAGADRGDDPGDGRPAAAGRCTHLDPRPDRSPAAGNRGRRRWLSEPESATSSTTPGLLLGSVTSPAPEGPRVGHRSASHPTPGPLVGDRLSPAISSPDRSWQDLAAWPIPRSGPGSGGGVGPAG